MIQTQLKLRMCKTQEKTAESWLPILGSVFNFAVRKVELNAKDKIYFSKNDFQNLLANHGERLEIPSHTLQGVLCTVHDAWKRCFKKIAGKPRLKGMRNKLTSIPFPDPIKAPKGNRITLPSLGSVRFYKMDIPDGKIKCGRMVKRASGWYLCLFIDAEPKKIERTGYGEIGIDSGFSNLLTTSDGEIIEHPRELEASARLHVLGKMLETLATPRTNISAYAPHIYAMKINPSRIGELIGPGGKVIRGIIEQTGVKIDVEDDGSVNVAATDERRPRRHWRSIPRPAGRARLGRPISAKWCDWRISALSWRFFPARTVSCRHQRSGGTSHQGYP